MSIPKMFGISLDRQDWRMACLVSSANVAWMAVYNRVDDGRSKTDQDKPTVYLTVFENAEEFEQVAKMKKNVKTSPISVDEYIQKCPQIIRMLPDLRDRAENNIIVLQYLATRLDMPPLHLEISKSLTTAYGDMKCYEVFAVEWRKQLTRI